MMCVHWQLPVEAVFAPSPLAIPARTMKTERRHELQTNVLADWLGHKTEAIRPYTKLILGGIGAVFVVAIAVTVITKQQSERSSRGWADYFAAATADPVRPDDLSLVAFDHAGTLPAVWATLKQADLELASGIRALYTFRDEATKSLEKARKLYAAVEAGAAGQPELKQAAQFGAAQAFEAEGNIDKAKEYYQLAIASEKDSSIGKQAQVRLELLDDDATEWLTWFAQATPQPRTPAGGFPGFPGFPGVFPGDDVNVPRDLTEIPGRPELSIPVPFEAANDRAESSLPIAGPMIPPPYGEAIGTETPDATTPDATTPDATTPDATTPDATTPDATTPDATTPDATTPDATTPDATTPDATTPDATTPDATTPDATTPDATTPDATTPDATTPDATTPDATTPDATTPDATTPDATTPDATTPDTSTPEPAKSGTTDEPSPDKEPADSNPAPVGEPAASDEDAPTGNKEAAPVETPPTDEPTGTEARP
jgi:hypothetical protein